MDLTLYKATELAAFERFVDTETGEVDLQGFEGSQIVLAEKQRAVTAYIKNRMVTLDMLDNAIKELQARKKTMQNGIDSLHYYLFQNMRIAGVGEINALDGTFTAKIKKNPPAVIVDDLKAIPEGFMKLPEPPPLVPNKAMIKDAISNGVVVPGAHLEQGERLEIK